MPWGLGSHRHRRSRCWSSSSAQVGFRGPVANLAERLNTELIETAAGGHNGAAHVHHAVRFRSRRSGAVVLPMLTPSTTAAAAAADDDDEKRTKKTGGGGGSESDEEAERGRNVCVCGMGEVEECMGARRRL